MNIFITTSLDAIAAALNRNGRAEAISARKFAGPVSGQPDLFFSRPRHDNYALRRAVAAIMRKKLTLKATNRFRQTSSCHLVFRRAVAIARDPNRLKTPQPIVARLPRPEALHSQ
jgi:hypothetical protein